MAEKIFDIQKRTYEYLKSVIFFLRSLPPDYVAQTLGKQLLRAATSIGANIIEAQASPSKRDFANFYNHSLKSANETKYWLALAHDCLEGSKSSVTALLAEAEEISKILGAILLKLRGKQRA